MIRPSFLPATVPGLPDAMPTLIYQRCFNHSAREAAARCPECGQFYCRECITEHDDRVICAACLRKSVKPPLTQRRGFIAALRLAQFSIGLFTVWIFFYFVGQALLFIDTSFHEGTVWQSNWRDSE